MTGYNGWKNWETWNVSLWAANDEPIYRVARQSLDWADFARRMLRRGMTQTPDGAAWDSAELDTKALDEFIIELSS